MKKSTKILIISAIVLFFTNLNVFGKTTYTFETRGSTAARTIGQITIECPCDMEFLKETYGLDKAGNYFLPTATGSSKDAKKTPNGEFFENTVNLDLPEDNYIPLFFPSYYFLDEDARVSFPRFGRYKYDPSLEYFYIGSWTITIDPYTFEITDIKQEDRFDEAKEWLSKTKNGKKKVEKFGRVEIEPLEEK